MYKLVLSDWWITKRRDQPQLSHQGINGQQDGRLVHTAIVRGWALLQSVWDQECRLCTFFAPTTSVIWITSSTGLGTFGLLLLVWSTFLSATDCPSCFPTITINLNRQTDDQNCPEIRNSNKHKVVRTSTIWSFVYNYDYNKSNQNLIRLSKHTSYYWYLGIVRLFV